ncbi:MAG: hypothetical protein O3A57_00840 [Bacteroidetes bacterium]|nr:hypothetical protein [Bacteroidota bacterium]
MKYVGKSMGKKLLPIGIIFLLAGFVTQGFTFSVESGMFNLGLIFTLGAMVSLGIAKMREASSSE